MRQSKQSKHIDGLKQDRNKLYAVLSDGNNVDIGYVPGTAYHKLYAYMVTALSRREGQYIKEYKKIISDDLKKINIPFEFSGDSGALHVKLYEKNVTADEVVQKLLKRNWQRPQKNVWKKLSNKKTILEHKERPYVIQIHVGTAEVGVPKSDEEVDREIEKEIERILQHNPEKIPSKIDELDMRDKIKQAIETDNIENQTGLKKTYRRYNPKEVPLMVIMEISQYNKQLNKNN